ncbi:MAG TPA: hypothetical protein VN922_17650 [Bacteroidia bacterium]|nr:hypothetical protein [Bacteroidia bacterium]
MGKKFKLYLSIPEPCTENWENMTPNERGRHCASCNKTVIDFSLFTDKQLIEFFATVTDNVCGRIPSFQLQRQLVYTEPQNHFLHKLLFGVAITAGFAYSANANYNPNQIPLIEQYPGDSVKNKTSQKAPTDSTGSILITVIDEKTKQTMPFVSVAVMKGGEQVGAGQTDMDGIVEIKSLDPGEYVIKTVFAGYYDFSLTGVPSITNLITHIIVKMKTMTDMPMHTVGALIISEPPAFDNSNGWDKQTLRRGDTPYR